MKELHLEKCPFCSGAAYVIKRHGIFGGVGYNIKCSCCGAATPIEDAGERSIFISGEFTQIMISDIEAIERLIARWNTRQTT